MRRLSEQDQSGDGVGASPYYSVLAKLFPKRTRCLKIQPKRNKAFLRWPLPGGIEAFTLDNPAGPDQAAQFAEKMRTSLPICLRTLNLAEWIASSDERSTSMTRSREKLR
ncbi:hypothetical protein NNRS527_01379 [Nitrosospira sp. NRS527]|nr:hypothetical protein NNRS527_01379 [Nitrosospira sp. NRS527]